MKIYTYIILSLVIFQSCDKCGRGIFSGVQRYYPFEFNYEFENITSIENIQSSYSLNDTIWFTIEIPESFSDKNSEMICDINKDELLIVNTFIYLASATDTFEYSSVNNFDVFFKTGRYNANNQKLLHLEKKQNTYKCTFGIVLDDLSYTSILWTFDDKITIQSDPSTSNYCNANPKCPDAGTGFLFKTKITGLDNTKFSFIALP